MPRSRSISLTLLPLVSTNRSASNLNSRLYVLLVFVMVSLRQWYYTPSSLVWVSTLSGERQPEAVVTLRRDFRATVTYYALEKQFPSWQRKNLRTTSHLERFNRNIRRRTRPANAYHSDLGVTAMMAQVVRKFHDAQPQQ
jgi:hypothetical protein